LLPHRVLTGKPGRPSHSLTAWSGSEGIKSSPVTDGCSSPVGLWHPPVKFHGDLLLKEAPPAFVADGLAPSRPACQGP